MKLFFACCLRRNGVGLAIVSLLLVSLALVAMEKDTASSLMGAQPLMCKTSDGFIYSVPGKKVANFKVLSDLLVNLPHSDDDSIVSVPVSWAALSCMVNFNQRRFRGVSLDKKIEVVEAADALNWIGVGWAKSELCSDLRKLPRKKILRTIKTLSNSIIDFEFSGDSSLGPAIEALTGARSLKASGLVEGVYVRDEEYFVVLLKENQNNHISWFKGKSNGECQAYKHRSVNNSFSLSPDGGFVELKSDGDVLVGYVDRVELNSFLKKSQNVRSISNIGRCRDGKTCRALAIDDGIELHRLDSDAWCYSFLLEIACPGVQEVVLSPDATLITAACVDGCLRTWGEDRRSGWFDWSPWSKLKKIYFSMPPRCFALTSNQRLIVSPQDGGIQVYDFNDSCNDFLLPDSQAVASLFFNNTHNILAANYASGGFKMWDVGSKKVLYHSKDQNTHCSFSRCENQVVVRSESVIRMHPVVSMLLALRLNQLPLSQQFFVWSLFKNKASINCREIRKLISTNNSLALSGLKKTFWKLFNNLPEEVQNLCLAVAKS